MWISIFQYVAYFIPFYLFAGITLMDHIQSHSPTLIEPLS